MFHLSKALGIIGCGSVVVLALVGGAGRPVVADDAIVPPVPGTYTKPLTATGPHSNFCDLKSMKFIVTATTITTSLAQGISPAPIDPATGKFLLGPYSAGGRTAVGSTVLNGTVSGDSVTGTANTLYNSIPCTYSF
jgi:hypothetical protein